MSNKLVVTRHPVLLQYLKDKGYVPQDVAHIPHADIRDVEGKHVFGILPLWLASHCDKLTEVQLRLPRDKRGSELTMEDMHNFAKSPLRTYEIKEISR